MIYFISDTHFNHENIMKFERTQFSCIKEHNEFIINLLKNTLRKDDILYHLGDFGAVTKEIAELWNSIDCKEKHIILGNHDVKSHLVNLFDYIYTTPIFFKKRVLLSHEPYPVKPTSINIHGHLHNAKLCLPNHINISLHVNNYKLLSEKEIEKIIMKIPKESEKFLQEWYAPYYQFTINRGDVVVDEHNVVKLPESLELRLKGIDI